MKLVRDTAGALFVEHLIAFLPVMYFFLVTWQLMELFVADLVVRRAANAAVRAAVVVLPDDPHSFGGDDANINKFEGLRREYVTRAAELILQASGHIEDNVSVELSGKFAEHNPITAEVRANFRCTASWVNIVCGGQPTRTLVARSTHVYQGARFSYNSI